MSITCLSRPRVRLAMWLAGFALVAVLAGAPGAVASTGSASCGLVRLDAYSNNYCGPYYVNTNWVQSTDSAGNATTSRVCSSVFSTGWAQIYPYDCDNNGAGYEVASYPSYPYGYAAARNSTSGAHYLTQSVWYQY
jgi:hypothetical protein